MSTVVLASSTPCCNCFAVSMSTHDTLSKLFALERLFAVPSCRDCLAPMFVSGAF